MFGFADTGLGVSSPGEHQYAASILQMSGQLTSLDHDLQNFGKESRNREGH